MIDHRSALYEGFVGHRRLEPRVHAFSYRVAMVHLDLSNIDQALAAHPLLDRRRGWPLQYRRSDYHGPAEVPLDEAVKDTVEARLGFRPDGPVTLLTQLRLLGWCFNPLSTYYCFAADGRSMAAQLLEVTNTPWKERAAYAIDLRDTSTGERWERRFAKALHVSPFMPMELTYRLDSTGPDDELELTLQTEAEGRTTFAAHMALARRPLDRRSVNRLLLGYPFMTHRVSAGIHYQAARLWAKRVPFVPHPDRHPERAAA